MFYIKVWKACPLQKSQYNSINYIINSTFRKIFNTRSQEVVDKYLEMFNCLPAEMSIVQAYLQRYGVAKTNGSHTAILLAVSIW